MDDGQPNNLWIAAFIAIAYPLFKLLDIFAHWIVSLTHWGNEKETARLKMLQNHKEDVTRDMSVLRQHIADIHKTTSEHFGVVEGRIADNHQDFLIHQASAVTHKELDEKLDKTKNEIKEHVSLTAQTILARLPKR